MYQAIDKNINWSHVNLQPIAFFLENLDLRAEACLSLLKVTLLGGGTQITANGIGD